MVILAPILCIIMVVIGVFLRYQERKMSKSSKLIAEFNDIAQYQQFKKQQLRILEMKKVLMSIKDTNASDMPFLLRFLVNQMKDISRTVLSFEELLDKKLKRYNQPQFNASSSAVKYKAEKELWDARNPAYSYWM